MIIRISKTANREDLDKALMKLKSKKRKLNLDKYFGKVKFGVDGLTYQKKIRNDWK